MRFLKVLRQYGPITRKMLDEPALEEIGRKYNLVLLTVFGSLAGGGTGPLSDIDIAFLKDKKVGLSEHSALLGELQAIFQREDIDLIDLAQAGPLLRMCVLKDGLAVYGRSKRDIIKFRYKTISDFLATQYLRNQFSYYLRKAVLGYGPN